MCVAYVAVDEDDQLLGFTTISNDLISKESLTSSKRKRLSLSHDTYTRIPATLIGRLGVSIEHQRKGVGELLVVFALSVPLESSKSIASTAVVLDPLSDEESRWYQEKFDFVPLKNDRRLFLPINKHRPGITSAK